MNEDVADDIKRRWGKAIEGAREGKLTQVELAQAVGSSQAAISRIERGVQEPTLELRLAIAKALGKTYEDLFSVPEGVS